MNSGFAVIPYAVFDAYERGKINQTQFTVLCLFYKWADHESGVVRDSSAERVLKFMGKQIDNASLKAMRQEIAKLRDAGWHDNDYQQGCKRPYNVFISGYTNPLSLFNTPFHTQVGDETKQTVGEKVRDNVCDEGSASHEKTETCQNPLDFGVREDVSENGHRRSHGKGSLNINGGQENKSEERDTAEVALRFAGFVSFLYGFDPNLPHVEALLRKYKPAELLFVLTEKFAPGERINKNTMAYFFRHGARRSIDVKRLDGTSETEPAWFKSKPQKPGDGWKPNRLWNYVFDYQEFLDKWNAVLDAYKQAFPDAVREETVATSGRRLSIEEAGTGGGCSIQ